LQFWPSTAARRRAEDWSFAPVVGENGRDAVGCANVAGGSRDAV